MTDQAPKHLTPEEQDRFNQDMATRLTSLERRDAVGRGGDILQRAAKTGGALMFFFGLARGAWRAAQTWLETPK